MSLYPFRTCLAVLLLLGISTSSWIFANFVGFDFYQYWGVAHARELSGGTLKSPYVELSSYVKVLDAYSARGDNRLRQANAANHQLFENGPDILGAPLLYALFSLTPLDYSRAYAAFLALKMMLFIGATALLLRCNRFYEKLDWPQLAIFPLIFAGSPFIGDFANGNVSALQYSAIVALIAFHEKFLKNCAKRNAFVLGAIFLSLLGITTLIKPNIMFVALALSASLWVLHGGRVFLSSSAVAALFGLAIAIIPCVHFGSWFVWADWLGYLQGVNAKHFYPVSFKNCSATIVLAQALGANINIVTAAMILLLSLHGLWPLLKKEDGDVSRIKSRAKALLRDPYLCAALGITIMFAVSPVVWNHYYVISLIPSFWLIAISPSRSSAAFLGLFSLIFTSGWLLVPFPPLLKGPVYSYMTAFGWVPLWLGTRVVIAERLEKLETATE